MGLALTEISQSGPSVTSVQRWAKFAPEGKADDYVAALTKPGVGAFGVNGLSRRRRHLLRVGHMNPARHERAEAGRTDLPVAEVNLAAGYSGA